MSISTALTPHFTAQKTRIEPLIAQGQKDPNAYGAAAKNFADNNLPLTKDKVKQFINTNALSFINISKDQKKLIKEEAASILKAYEGLGADTQYKIDDTASYITDFMNRFRVFPGLEDIKPRTAAVLNNQIVMSNADKTRIATHQLICEAIKASVPSEGLGLLSKAKVASIVLLSGAVGAAGMYVAAQQGMISTSSSMPQHFMNTTKF